MSTKSPELHDCMPREQVGADTGAKYEFQYFLIAYDALTVLDDQKVVCIYCEWHDDYVIEQGNASAKYVFCQVKSRGSPAWNANSLTKVSGSKTTKQASKNGSSKGGSPLSRMFEHHQQFSDNCGECRFITDGEFGKEFDAFLASVQSAAAESELSPKDTRTFESIAEKLDKGASKEAVFGFLKKFRTAIAVITSRQMTTEVPTSVLVAEIMKNTEVSLRHKEAVRIANELLGVVRRRSQKKLGPTCNATELQQEKGITIRDVLQILSLSVEGYTKLRQKGISAVQTLSRLQRFAHDHKFPDSAIEIMCSLKATWQAWNQQQGLSLQWPSASLELQQECSQFLSSTPTHDFASMRKQAKQIAQKYEGSFATTSPLSEEHIMGLFLELVVRNLP